MKCRRNVICSIQKKIDNHMYLSTHYSVLKLESSLSQWERMISLREDGIAPFDAAIRPCLIGSQRLMQMARKYAHHWLPRPDEHTSSTDT